MRGLAGSWGEVRQSSLNLNYGITLSRGGWVRFPRLWSRFWPSFTCVCLLLLGWKGCPCKSMKQELFDIVLFSLLRLSSLSPLAVICVKGFVVVCCWWGGMVVVLCACLLLPVEGLSLQEEWGKSLTVSGSLSSDLIMHGWEGWLRLFSEGWALVPPRFLHFSHSSCLASVYLFVDGVEARALQPI